MVGLWAKHWRRWGREHKWRRKDLPLSETRRKDRKMSLVTNKLGSDGSGKWS